jgi:hypothetical protein
VKLVAAVVLVLVALFAPQRAQAHQNSITHLRITAEGRSVEAVVRIDAVDLNEALGAPAGLALTREQARVGADLAAAYVRERLTVSDSGQRCVATEHSATTHDTREEFELAITQRWECPHAIEALSLHYDLFFDVDPRHQGMTSLVAHGAEVQHIFRNHERRLERAWRRSLSQQLYGYVRLGIEHIFVGYDHIAFLVALMLVVGARPTREALRNIVLIVSSFTLAHSLTLVGAALGWVTLSARLVEPAIALSIAWVAIENVVVAEPRARTALTFAFGLVHGFGFAGVLAEQGLPARAAVASLLAFNVGVEVGQLAIVTASLPVLAWLRREGLPAPQTALALASLAAIHLTLRAMGVATAPLVVVLWVGVPLLALASRRWGYARGVRTLGSLALGALALLWFIERICARTLFGGALG